MSTSETLAAAQGALVRALGGQGSALPGFNARRLNAMIGILAAKRRRAVASACPSLRRGLGARFEPLFSEYARHVPLSSNDHARADVCRFLAWLRDRRALPRETRVVTFRVGRSRRIVVAWLGSERRLLLG